MCARRSRRRSPELQAGLDRLKREVAGTLKPRGPSAAWGSGPARSGQPGHGPMVSRLLELADRHLARRRSSRQAGPDLPPPRPEP